MAFRFETANERWKTYKQSIMEHPRFRPADYSYSDQGSPDRSQSDDPRGHTWKHFKRWISQPGVWTESPTRKNLNALYDWHEGFKEGGQLAEQEGFIPPIEEWTSNKDDYRTNGIANGYYQRTSDPQKYNQTLQQTHQYLLKEFPKT